MNNNQNAFLQSLRRNIKRWIHQKNWIAAQDALAELKRLDPLDLQTRGLELEYSVGREQYQDAEILAHQLIQLFPTSSRIHYLAGLVAYRQKKYTKAKTDFKESNELYPHWHTERYIGKTCTQSGQFEEAESQLLPLMHNHPVCLLDLAWLYERKQQYARAQAMLEQYLIYNPYDPFAEQQKQRLQTHTLSPEQIKEEVESLDDFGESIPIDLLIEYVRKELSQGKGRKIRDMLTPRIKKYEPKEAVQLGWACYQLKAYELAYGLMAHGFENQHDNYKYCKALEVSAERSGRLDEIISLYSQFVETDSRFYGRVVRLKKKI